MPSPADPYAPYGSHCSSAAFASGSGMVYQVQFKGTIRFFILGAHASPSIAEGNFVIVEADRGEDMGIVTDILPMKAFIDRRNAMRAAGLLDDEDSAIGRILRQANQSERSLLQGKYHDEQNVLQFCREIAHHSYRLPLLIQDAEYQFDRRKLSIYYVADGRVDFRELVRDLFSAFKARIWMKRMNPTGSVRLDPTAQMALATGGLPSSFTS